MHASLESRIDQLAGAGRVRVLAFGSSNTERHIPGMHWLDCVHLGFREKYGPVGHFTNTGICGDTSRDLLARFDTDAAALAPHLVFLTIGGNDSWTISEAEYEANLRELHRRFDALGAHVIFQTYYAPISTPENPHTAFYRFSDRVRAVAADTGASLVDNLRRWVPMREHHREFHRALMRDDFHLNERGNKVLGFDIARSIGCPVSPEVPYWSEAIEAQAMMDRLDGSRGGAR